MGNPRATVTDRRRWAILPFVAVIRAYQYTLSPFIGGQCRFEPTCSRYALEAYERFGVLKGTRLTVMRLLRCHPFCKGGFDPVPTEHGTRNRGSGS